MGALPYYTVQSPKVWVTAFSVLSGTLENYFYTHAS